MITPVTAVSVWRQRLHWQVDGAMNTTGITATGTINIDLTLFPGAPNDLFANGIPITPGSPSLRIRNDAAAAEIGEPDIGGSITSVGNKTLWYR